MKHFESIPLSELPKLTKHERDYIIGVINKYHRMDDDEKNKLYKTLKAVVLKDKWLKQNREKK